MKNKSLNGLFAATAFSLMFANASIAASAEELPDESAVVSEEEDSAQTEQSEEQENAAPDSEFSASQDGAGQLLPDGGPITNQNSGYLPESGLTALDQNTAGETGDPDGENNIGEQSSGLADGEEGEESVSQEETGSGNMQFSDQDGTVQTESGSDSGQSSSLPDSDEEGEEGNSGSGDAGIQENGLGNLEETKENFDKAEEEKAQTETGDAQDNAGKDGQEIQKTEKELNQNQTNGEETEKQESVEDKESAGTGQEFDEAQTGLGQALQDAGINAYGVEKAQQDTEEKKSRQETAGQAVAGPEADYNVQKAETRIAARAAVNTTEEARKDIENAAKDKDAADQAVADAQKEADDAQESYDNALDEVGANTADGNAASETLKKAQEILDAVKKKIASGSLGFFQYLGEAGSDSAKVAMQILTATDKSGAPGVGSESQWTAGSWDEFIAYTHLGGENDATSLENMKKTIAFMKECNELRTSDNNFPNLSELLVNDALMAIAQLNANWATWTADNKYNGHSKVFNAGENLAWYYVDIPGLTDPFKGWYYEEKATYDKKENGVTGHYINITDSSYTATGFGINISKDSRGELRLNCAQEFSGSNVNYYGYGQCYSVEEYEARFMEYYNALMKELSDAQAAYDAARAAYGQAIGGAENQALIESRKEELDKATAKLEEAKANAEEKMEILQEAQNAYQEALANADNAQEDHGGSGSQEGGSSAFPDYWEAGDSEAADASAAETNTSAAETDASAAEFNAMPVINLAAIDSSKATVLKDCSFKSFLENTRSFVEESSFSNLTIDCSDSSWYSFNKKILETLSSGLGKALTVVFKYKGQKYMFTIPSGFNLELLQDSHGWYGFMYLKTIFGGYEVV